MTTPSLPPERFYGRPERQACFGSFTLTECRYEPLQVLPRHRHQEAFVCLVVAGSFEERVATTTRTCERGAVVFHPPGEIHCDRVSSDGARILNISLGARAWARVAALPGTDGPVPGIHRGISSAVAAQLYQRFREDASGAADLAVEGLALTLLAECCRSGVRRENRAPRWLGTVLELLRAAAPQQVSLLRAADEVGVHPTHLARTFRQHVGETLGDHVRRLRVAWASEQLAKGDRSLSQIALDGGFADQAHFCRVYRRLTGLTPGAYRRRFGR
jgi:AraC family transcriptional regulator